MEALWHRHCASSCGEEGTTMQNRSKAPIVLAALLFILAAVAEIVTSHTVMVDGAPAPVERASDVPHATS